MDTIDLVIEFFRRKQEKVVLKGREEIDEMLQAVEEESLLLCVIRSSFIFLRTKFGNICWKNSRKTFRCMRGKQQCSLFMDYLLSPLFLDLGSH